ncbi:hypothetical protein L9F63_022614 [Diploptera punctata]|uniref:Zinc transporter ZIP1 n=1 Tax=Diploptera punctata TaxID=6984 RepID=A0AAD7ZMC9_DIPPU|nr:hypothetical protein L9F63_022614 [Diploptera punctata]
MDLMVAKCIVLVVLLVATFVSSMLPLKLLSKINNTEDELRRSRYRKMMSLMSCFAAGVFMGTGLLDLFPEVNELLSKAVIYKYTKSSFPVSEFTVSFGFFLVLILEQIVKEFRHRPLDLELGGSNNELDESKPHPTFRSFMLLLALSVHSVFEGLAISLQANLNDIIQIFLAVIIHKVVIAFSLGLNLIQTDISLTSVIKSNILFCLTSPVGIAIGIFLEEFGQVVSSSILNGVLQGLACGTFVYVTFFEVLPHELSDNSNRMFKLISVILGFSVVCCVLFLDPTEAAECIKS